MLAVVILTVLMMCLAGCAVGPDQGEAEAPKVSVRKAKKIALEDAGVNTARTLVTRRKLTSALGKPEYTICFTSQSGNNTTRYQYTIDGLDGAVLERSKRIRTFAETRTVDDTEGTEDSEGAEFIGVAKARAAILKDAGLDEKETSFKVVRLESRRDRDVYVVEFDSMGISYLFDIDAYDGTVISREVRFDD